MINSRGGGRPSRLSADRFEFQMLHGVRRNLQTMLVAGGLPGSHLRALRPEWFPYFMRRLGERPANVMFVLRSLIREGGRNRSRSQRC